jgi:ADP-heptose:LPS heptosyltransferase
MTDPATLVTNIAAAPAPLPQVDDFWALARSAVYLRGRGVTFGPPLLQDSAINPKVYSVAISLQKADRVAGVDVDLSIFADGSLDHVLVTPALQAAEEPIELLRSAASKLKVGGHLLVFVELGSPRPGHCEIPKEQLLQVLPRVGKWRLKDSHTENGKYLVIVKKCAGGKGWEIAPSSPVGRKRACIARYGALGDAIVMTPLIRALAEDGYEVTLNVSSYCVPVFDGNPYIHNLLIQERDVIPNAMLGRYWGYWAPHYDKYINLSESIEGDLLFVEGRSPFFTTKEWRHAKANVNYYDYTLARGGYPLVTGKNGELFFTNAEERRAKKFFLDEHSGHFTIVWALNGSSHHKVFPLLDPVLREWLREKEDVRVVTVGDGRAQSLEFPHPQLIPKAGVWSIRESLIATKYADLVVGPETMMTNAAGCFPTPKLVFLSHSTEENLTKYWKNCVAMAPTSAPCYPCHQLHYTAESCPIGEVEDIVTGEVLGRAPLCTVSIPTEEVLTALDQQYKMWKEKYEK